MLSFFSSGAKGTRRAFGEGLARGQGRGHVNRFRTSAHEPKDCNGDEQGSACVAGSIAEGVAERVMKAGRQTTLAARATVSGIGKLTYAGNPGKLQKNVTGLGSITAQ